MSDDWRLRIALREPGQLHKLTGELEASELEHELETAFHDRLVISRDQEQVFCYGGSREQVEQAEELVRSLAASHRWESECQLQRWHESAEQWEDPDIPLPRSDAERAAEHAELVRREREELKQRGYPEFEVRAEFGSHRDAVAFADQLRQEGIPNVRRWKYLVVGASDEDSANALAERLRREAGPGTTVIAEGSGKLAYDERPSNPFWFLGGLSG